MAVTTLSETRWRMFIGPYYTDFTWTGINTGNALFGSEPVSTVATTQTSGSTSLVLTSGTPFPTSGGVWVGGNAASQGWEYEKYTGKSTNTLTGITRESTTDRDHNGVHNSGATVYYYYPVSTNTGTLVWSEEADDNVSTLTWTASVSGVLAPHYVMRENHVVIVETATNSGAWSVYLVGFLSSPQIQDDSKSTATWSFTINSLAQLLGSLEADGVRAGDNLLSRDGSSSTPLVLAFDERASNDYTKASPDFSATSVTDNENNTLWIAERYKGDDIWSDTYNNDPENSYSSGTGVRFSQVYINPPTSAGPGARWIELAIGNTSNHEGFALYRANGGTSVEWQYGGPGTVASGDRILLVEDEATFSRLNPLCNAKQIYENRDFFSGIDPTGGELWLRLGELNQWQARMRWGHGDSYVQHPDAPSRTWTGSTITAPGEGQTMRYIFTVTSGTASAYWNTSMVRHAGYDLDLTEPEWVMVTFPGFGLTLANDITSGSPGASGSLYILGPDEKTCVDGLPNSGTLVIGDEKITYSAKSIDGGYVTVTARGASSTTAASHNAGDEVYILDGSIATDAFLVEQVGWTRYNGTIYPKVFKAYTTNLIENVRTPADDDYTNDWTLRGNVTAHASSSYLLSLSNIRVRHLLLEIYEMTGKPARPRINELFGYLNPANHDTGQWLDADATVDEMIEQIVVNVGLPSAAVIVSGSLPELDNVQTEGGNDAWTVIADLAEFTGSVVEVGRDSKLYLSLNDFWDGSLSVSHTWSRSNARSAQMSVRPTQRVSQVVLPWRTADGLTTGTVYYPTDPADGIKLELPETIYANSSAATTAARRLYFMRRFPAEFVVQSAIAGNDEHPLEVHAISWQFNLDHATLTRNCVCLGAEHTLTNGAWSSEFRLLQYGHESNIT